MRVCVLTVLGWEIETYFSMTCKSSWWCFVFLDSCIDWYTHCLPYSKYQALVLPVWKFVIIWVKFIFVSNIPTRLKEQGAVVVNKGVGLIVLLEIHFAGRSSVNIVFPLSGNAVCSPSVCVMKWSRSLYFVYSDIHMQRYCLSHCCYHSVWFQDFTPCFPLNKEKVEGHHQNTN